MMSNEPEAEFNVNGGDGVLSMAGYFVRLYEYDRWANGLLLDALDGLGDVVPAKAINRMSHLVACQRLWMARMGRGLEMPATIFPEISLVETRAEAERVFAEMRDYVKSLTEGDDAGIFERFHFEDLKGQRHSALIYEILTQLSQHGCYHRGQMAVDLNPLLESPIATDWVYYVWRNEA